MIGEEEHRRAIEKISEKFKRVLPWILNTYFTYVLHGAVYEKFSIEYTNF